MKKVLVLIVGLLSISLNGQNLQSSLDSIVLKQGVADTDPGLFVGLVQGGKIVYHHISGLSNLQHGIKADANTACNIASSAKQFTALMILNLVDQKRIGLEDDIRTYFPNLYPKVQDSIKIRHLLNHSSGIRDYCDLMGLQQNPWWRREGLNNEEVLEFIEKQESLAFKPGTQYCYSNTGYNLLAELIEKVTQEDFISYSNRFFQNLGMHQTGFPKNYMQVIPQQALPYSDWGDGAWQQYPMITSTYGEGFLFTTLDDQLHYEQLLQKAQSEENKLLLQSQKAIPNSEIKSYGYGLNLYDRHDYPAVHHDGATGSYSSQVLRFPELELSIFIMSNNSRVNTDALLNEICSLVLPPKKQMVRYSNFLDSVPKTNLKSKLFAQYRSASGKLVRIEQEEGQAYWRTKSGKGISLEAEATNVYHPYYDKSIKLGFFEEGLILFKSNGDTTYYPKVNSLPANEADLKSLQGRYYSNELDIEFEILEEHGGLAFKLGKWKNPCALQVYNRNELGADNYLLKVHRDPFERVSAIYLSYGRALNNSFKKIEPLGFQPQIQLVEGSIQVSTLHARDASSSSILVTKNDSIGNEVWYRKFGGSSYDKASSIMAVSDGYIIVGSTSSYGEGNYDILLFKINGKGELQWQETYGYKMNDYGYTVEQNDKGFLIKGSTQECLNNVSDCTTRLWIIQTNFKGELLREEVLEELPKT
jgi:CubicO group peptidase (beta-lactamase class C family)